MPNHPDRQAATGAAVDLFKQGEPPGQEPAIRVEPHGLAGQVELRAPSVSRDCPSPGPDGDSR